LSRLVKLIVFLGMVGLFTCAVGFGFVFILSGGDIIGFAQTTLLRLSLSSRQDDLERPAGTDATPRRFTINSGDSPTAVANNLLNAGLIRDADLFVDYVQFEGLDTQLEAATYFLNETQTIPQIAYVLIDSANSNIPFRILEGQRIEEIATLIDQNHLFAFTGQDFLNVVSSGAVIDPVFAAEMGIPVGASLEGFLFPDTYILPPEITPEGLRDELLENFKAKIGTQMAIDAAAQGYTMRDMVSLAAIIQREAVWDDEQPLISSVYRNRMTIGMKLDADPTVQYGLQGTRDSWWPRITAADYNDVISPYNTYLNNGLPPGPIANPGITAIRAAVYPAESSYYYFRAKCDGSGYHVFATTFEEQVANGC
jgi:UPF0755 protein